MADFILDADPLPLDYAGNRLERACIPWRGPIDKNGYGKVYVGLVDGKKRWMLPHRVAYEQHVGSIPPGYQIDHLCQHRDCVEPTQRGGKPRSGARTRFSETSSAHVAHD